MEIIFKSKDFFRADMKKVERKKNQDRQNVGCETGKKVSFQMVIFTHHLYAEFF